MDKAAEDCCGVGRKRHIIKYEMKKYCARWVSGVARKVLFKNEVSENSGEKRCKKMVITYLVKQKYSV
ncbi:MAG: hypothetical protein ACRDL7_11245 [Gaiellaceae bacterium]